MAIEPWWCRAEQRQQGFDRFMAALSPALRGWWLNDVSSFALKVG